MGAKDTTSSAQEFGQAFPIFSQREEMVASTLPQNDRLCYQWDTDLLV